MLDALQPVYIEAADYCTFITHSRLLVITVRERLMLIMKFLLVLGCLAVAVFAEKYTDKYDNLDLDEIIHNKRLFLAYCECIMGREKCTPEGKVLQEHLQEAIETGCAKCTEAQEKGATKVIEHLIKNEPKIWEEFCAKFDPDSKWRKTYEERARANGIIIPKD